MKILNRYILKEFASSFIISLSIIYCIILVQFMLKLIDKLLGKGISFTLIQKALQKKIHVVTANKALLAKHGNELFKLADKNKVFLLFEAAVAGGIPIIKSIKV